MGSERSPGSARRAVVRTLLTVSLFGGVVFAVDQLVPGARHRLGQASLGWLAVVLALELVACSGYVLLFQAAYSRAPWVVKLRRGVQIALGELGAFAITPTGLGGPLLKIWALRTGGMPWRPLIVRSISQGVIFNLPYVLAAAVLGIGVSVNVLPGHAPLLTALAPLALVLVVGLLTGLAAWLGRSGTIAAEFPKHPWLESALATIPDGLIDAVVLARRPRSLLGSVGWWAGDCAALWAAFQAVGGSPALSVLILAYMLGQLGNTLPLPGGVGGVEPLMLGIFSASGVNLGLAAAAVICYRAIALGVQGTLGVTAFVSLVADVRQERRGPTGIGEPAPALTPPS